MSTLSLRVERLEAARGRAAVVIVRQRSDGAANATVVKDGRVIERRELSSAEAARLSRGALLIARAYGLGIDDAA